MLAHPDGFDRQSIAAKVKAALTMPRLNSLSDKALHPDLPWNRGRPEPDLAQPPHSPTRLEAGRVRLVMDTNA